MAENSKIEWTDHTFNPWMGCTKVSPACKNCYAERDFDHRYGKVNWGPSGTRVVTSASNWRKPLRWNREAGERGVRTRVFCASLADVFEDWSGGVTDANGIVTVCDDGSLIRNPDCPMGHRQATLDDLRRLLFELIDQTPNLDWLLLTKRPENIRRMWPTWPSGAEPDGGSGRNSGSRYLKNVWIGCSVENQEYADKRIPALLKCRDLSPVLFLSCEPLVRPVNFNVPFRTRSHFEVTSDGPMSNDWTTLYGNALTGFRASSMYSGTYDNPKVDWVITGGESGPGARPADPNWFRSLRDQCESAGTPFHFKQWGEFDQHQKRVGKKAAGRLLDGRTHDGVPHIVCSLE